MAAHEWQQELDVTRVASPHTPAPAIPLPVRRAMKKQVHRVKRDHVRDCSASVARNRNTLPSV